MNFGEPFSRVKFASSMKNANAVGPAKNTIVSPRIRVFQMLPWRFVRSSVNANGFLRNASASPKYGRPIDPGGGVVMGPAKLAQSLPLGDYSKRKRHNPSAAKPAANAASAPSCGATSASVVPWRTSTS